MPYIAKGFTLLELLIALTIATLLFGVGVPSFFNFLERQNAIIAINSIAGAVNYARTEAIVRGRTVTLCPRFSDTLCGKNWQQGMNIFLDLNGNGKLDKDDTLLRVTPTHERGSQLKWASFGSNNYLRFSASGYTKNQNGSFTYCPASKNVRNARAIIINRQGRARRAQDKNENGILENAKGEDLSC